MTPRPPAGGGEPISPLDDPDIWLFTRSDTGVTTESTEGDGLNHLAQWDNLAFGVGHASHMTNTITKNGPIVDLNALNGHPVMRGLRTSPSNCVIRSVGVTIFQPYTVYLLVKVTNNTSTVGQIIWDSVNGNGYRGVLHMNTQNSNELRMYSGGGVPDITCPNSDLAFGNWGIYTAVFDDASSSLTVNNGTPVTCALGGTLSCPDPGINPACGNAYGMDYVAECSYAAVIVSSVHSSSTWLANHKAWLAWYGGLTI
jgi:hypothetical protein